VSGDSIAQQQRALEEFLSIQKENTEISYFTSELTMESPDFRRIICRQLLGQKVGSFVRPLKELLKDLHEQPGPFLLCIKQAQTLPNPFLQELWDWVTESKKLSPNHHVNVILFGETAWAEKAKKWLPKRNSSRPVLLSTQSVDSTKFDVNALENLMAEERPVFSLDIFRRDEFASPIVTQKWFIVSVLVLLLSVFIGLMSWQYPDHVKSLLQTGSLPPEANVNADQLALINEQLDIDRKESIADETLVTETTQDNIELVSSWDAAKKTSDNKIDALKLIIDEQKDVREQDALSTSNLEQPALKNDDTDKTETSNSEFTLEDTEGDFAVPDILSVEQLDASLGNQLLTPIQDQNLLAEIVEPEIALNNVSASAQQQEIEKSVVTEQTNSPFYEFDESALLALTEPAVLLQLSGIQNRTVLNEFIADNQLQDIVLVYQTTRYGGAWHVVLFNQRFDSVNAARQAVELLPESVRSTEPFAKDLTQIKLEIRNR
jgi:DamX protein